MFGGSFSHISVYQCFPFSPLYLMICGAYFIDFHDNLISIQNSLYGGINGNRNEALSIMAFMKKYDAAQASKLESDLKAALKALEDCQTQLKGGFVSNISNPLVGEAQKKIQTMDEDLNKAAEWFSKQ